MRDYYERAEKRGMPLEVTLNNGVGPAVHVAATVPGSAATIDKDELGIASSFTGQPDHGLQVNPSQLHAPYRGFSRFFGLQSFR